jgi:2-polyprenyl-3-methyl-5-hydroxy-6-metoxy-1,4-benzoquinol methylase
MIRCRVCGHRYTDPIPTDAELAAMYDSSYFSAEGAWVCGYWEGSYVGNEQRLREEAREALPHIGRLGGRLLEVGPAGGYFLDEARKVGFDVTGIELNAEMAEWGRANLGLNIMCGLFEDAPVEPCSFDVVVAQDVLEHVRDPQGFVRRAASLLRPGGIFFVRGPLEQSSRDAFYLAVREHARHEPLVRQEPPYHLQGFVRTSFERVVNKAGLQLAAFHANPLRPAWRYDGAKQAAASVIETLAYQADVLLGGGDFMTARAIKAT